MGILGTLLGNDDIAAVPAPSKPVAADSWPRKHVSRNDEVAKAAGVGLVRVRCHHTTWDYLQEQVHHQHEQRILTPPQAFRPLADAEITTGSDGIVTVLLGGSSLAVVLDWCHEMQSVLNQDSERAIGKRGGLAISRALDNPTPCDGRTRSTTVIWLDDQIAVENPTSTP
ncbi:hypothetical protein OHU11_01310 [Streptomyces sp. NBC_00257]|uniref:hypothetical protein n=1 Tax=unclassified Streptomyces TaxID=2593676 RepID=UPI0022556563|nr:MULTISPECIES: hypothetical protein [unclassified Streptomyces]WTB59340.1 hypothetical protein OG832_42620 [Streptomyces sp. NBC_00826]WTH87788.1 hypothetical protein OIC43_01105 [Streptomyces sp. NBC_00825]WTH96515.1 hypothetical protein OHA23_01110 [Streptomyces sp. NBC_00822]MCX4869980.1 hypothetical protein [Streptomyces sp. NBC_00906]MCX4901143.1 hypothetical protein [Streptomyces sp. NBC_00892]